MTERKFTDEEVIKALECCLNEDCENCPARMCCDDDTESFVKYVFDLIARQKAEIESLEAENRGFSICLDSAVKTALKIKCEAIKEFAKRLKCHSYQSVGDNGYISPYREVAVEDIDNLVKEMTEGSNGKS